LAPFRDEVEVHSAQKTFGPRWLWHLVLDSPVASFIKWQSSSRCFKYFRVMLRSGVSLGLPGRISGNADELDPDGTERVSRRLTSDQGSELCSQELASWLQSFTGTGPRDSEPRSSYQSFLPVREQPIGRSD
jgi:hypothetical protein